VSPPTGGVSGGLHAVHASYGERSAEGGALVASTGGAKPEREDGPLMRGLDGTERGGVCGPKAWGRGCICVPVGGVVAEVDPKGARWKEG